LKFYFILSFPGLAVRRYPHRAAAAKEVNLPAKIIQDHCNQTVTLLGNELFGWRPYTGPLSAGLYTSINVYTHKI
jgi:hypothetical protein